MATGQGQGRVYRGEEGGVAAIGFFMRRIANVSKGGAEQDPALPD
jgi:hypothetical protein